MSSRGRKTRQKAVSAPDEKWEVMGWRTWSEISQAKFIEFGHLLSLELTVESETLKLILMFLLFTETVDKGSEIGSLRGS